VPDVNQQLDELRRELRDLRDRQDILDCINSYGRGLDRLDADLIRNAYHADAIDQHGTFVGGVDMGDQHSPVVQRFQLPGAA
jgi:SnoaL-like domain